MNHLNTNLSMITETLVGLRSEGPICAWIDVLVAEKPLARIAAAERAGAHTNHEHDQQTSMQPHQIRRRLGGRHPL
jgi:hypothetical protein